ncbi:hypothetical protein ACFXPY_35500 [Streptomyces sp. NPDC059153]|uniref:hypothetical protein n=1 Tax=Streptomyces sp. NPDC059153 TaxID=3346743 RepID=UPI0036AC63F0
MSSSSRPYEQPDRAEDIEHQAVEDDQADDDLDLYERLMRQAPTSRDSRGRRACRHVVGRRGIR